MARLKSGCAAASSVRSPGSCIRPSRMTTILRHVMFHVMEYTCEMVRRQERLHWCFGKSDLMGIGSGLGGGFGRIQRDGIARHPALSVKPRGREWA